MSDTESIQSEGSESKKVKKPVFEGPPKGCKVCDAQITKGDTFIASATKLDTIEDKASMGFYDLIKLLIPR